MIVIDFMMKNVMSWIVTVVTCVVLFTLLEPFRSNFLLAILAAFTVGMIYSMIDLAIHRIVKKLRMK